MSGLNPKCDVDDPIVEERDPSDDTIEITPEWVEWHLSKPLTHDQVDGLRNKLLWRNSMTLEVVSDTSQEGGIGVTWRPQQEDEESIPEVQQIANQCLATFSEVNSPTRRDHKMTLEVYEHRIRQIEADAIHHHGTTKYLSW